MPSPTASTVSVTASTPSPRASPHVAALEQRVDGTRGEDADPEPDDRSDRGADARDDRPEGRAHRHRGAHRGERARAGTDGVAAHVGRHRLRDRLAVVQVQSDADADQRLARRTAEPGRRAASANRVVGGPSGVVGHARQPVGVAEVVVERAPAGAGVVGAAHPVEGLGGLSGERGGGLPQDRDVQVSAARRGERTGDVGGADHHLLGVLPLERSSRALHAASYVELTSATSATAVFQASTSFWCWLKAATAEL